MDQLLFKSKIDVQKFREEIDNNVANIVSSLIISHILGTIKKIPYQTSWWDYFNPAMEILTDTNISIVQIYPLGILEFWRSQPEYREKIIDNINSYFNLQYVKFELLLDRPEQIGFSLILDPTRRDGYPNLEGREASLPTINKT